MKEQTISNLKKLKSFHNGSYGADINRAIQALEQQPCEDSISREAVEKITWEEPSYTDALNVLTEVREKVRALPSVTPSIEDWLSSFNTESVTQCFNAVQELKKRLEGDIT